MTTRKNNNRLKIGGHVSAAGGPRTGITHARRIGAECIQIFGSSPQQWHVKMPSTAQIKDFRAALGDNDLPVYLHAPYLVNLASPDATMIQKSIHALSDHLKIAEVLGARGLIFHVGSGKGADKDEVLKTAARGMKETLKNVPGKTQLIIENTAGGGSKIGATLDEVAELVWLVKSPRVKVCIDTAHAFEAGVLDYSPASIKKFFDEFDEKIGIENLAALHANDSKTLFGSHNDRHENIGAGAIGLTGFKNLAKEKRLWDKDWLLEVPGFDGEGPDAKNIAILKSCFGVKK
ncbi:MAG: deoxyribonuclease IV [Candidatus Niyogibacteria bacterium]|nr:deoxyribonuclease IV [Candidatus Niyogibacteria bacterium]